MQVIFDNTSIEADAVNRVFDSINGNFSLQITISDTALSDQDYINIIMKAKTVKIVTSKADFIYEVDTSVGAIYSESYSNTGIGNVTLSMPVKSDKTINQKSSR